MGKATYARNAVLNAILNQGSFTAAAVWAGLHSADPGLTGANELTGNGYGRVDCSASFPAAALGSCVNDAAIEFAVASGAWPAATHGSLWDAQTTGNCLKVAKLGTWAGGLSAYLAWLRAELAYLQGDASDPGAAPAFTAAPITIASGTIARLPIGAFGFTES